MTAAPKSAELLPCPFCGGEASVIAIGDGRQVSCKGRPRVHCFAKGPASFHGSAGWAACEAQAITAWNTRALAAQTPAAVEGNMIPNPNLSPELIKALKAWQPEGDDRVRPLLLAEADRRDAVEYNVTDANHVIAFLLARLDAAISPPGEVERSLEAQRQTIKVCTCARRHDPDQFDHDATCSLYASPTPPDAGAEDSRLTAIFAYESGDADGYARGIEDAAKVAVDYAAEFKGKAGCARDILERRIFECHHFAAKNLAAAIRFSSGGGK